MSNVNVPFGDNRADTAVLLLEAAEATDNEPGVVSVDHFTNSYIVPEEVAKKAGLDTFDPDADFNAAVEKARKDAEANDDGNGNLLSVDGTKVADENFADPGPATGDQDEAPAPAKKPATKKPAAKKPAAKKTAAKKTAANKTAAKK